MTKDAFKDRERGLEEEYFRKSEAKLIEKIREKAKLDEIAAELAKTLEVEDPELLGRVIELGITRGSGAALLLAPLVQEAWAEGKVTEKERETVLRLAATRGVEKGSPAEAQLLAWLEKKPSDAVFRTAVEVIRTGLAKLTPKEREDLIQRYAQACHEVAQASGLARVLGGSGESSEERSVLDQLVAALREV